VFDFSGADRSFLYFLFFVLAIGNPSWMDGNVVAFGNGFLFLNGWKSQ
jgi:hypothetical protein